MKISIKYNSKKYIYIIKINNSIFMNFIIRKFIDRNKLKNISLIIYNYMIVIKLLRNFGLSKPLINRKDF